MTPLNLLASIPFKTISFLDVQVTIGEGGVLTTDLVCKPTDTHQFWQRKSCHPWHTKKAIPYSQALRYRRICSEDRQFQSRLGELAGWLNDRGYEESLANEQIDRVRRLDIETLLATTGKEPNPGRDERIPLVITYHPALNSVGKTLGISTLYFPVRKSIGWFFLNLRSLHLDDVRTLRIY